MFKKRGRLKAHVWVLWQSGQSEPWCLVTNAPHVSGAAYARRVWQEEDFRDLKSGGWPWQRSHIWPPPHAERLILVLALAYAWVLTQGTLLLHAEPAVRARITHGTRRRYSLFRKGLRCFRLSLHHPSQLYPGLFFAPDILLC